jgi:hypothetical protein
MNKLIVVLVAVWMAAMGSALLLTYELHRPLAVGNGSSAISARLPLAAPAPVVEEAVVDDAIVDNAEPAVLQLPMVTIVASRHGVTEMQGAGEAPAGGAP